MTKGAWRTLRWTGWHVAARSHTERAAEECERNTRKGTQREGEEASQRPLRGTKRHSRVLGSQRRAFGGPWGCQKSTCRLLRGTGKVLGYLGVAQKGTQRLPGPLECVEKHLEASRLHRKALRGPFLKPESTRSPLGKALGGLGTKAPRERLVKQEGAQRPLGQGFAFCGHGFSGLSPVA